MIIRWSNQAPMVMSLQLDQSWSILQQSNIIAANQAPDRRHMGGGIFSNGVALATYFDASAKNASKVLVATVPVVPIGTESTLGAARRHTRQSIKIDGAPHNTNHREHEHEHEHEREHEHEHEYQQRLRGATSTSRRAAALATATNTSAVCHSWGLEARCTAFSPSLNRTGHLIASWNDIVCELEYSIASAPQANETWVVFATEFPSNNTHDIDHFYARFCVAMACPRFPNCLPYYTAPKTVFSAFRLVAGGPGFAPAPTKRASHASHASPASVLTTPRIALPMINQTIPQPPANNFWTTVARDNAQALNGTQYEIAQGGREIRSTKFFTATRLYSVSIGGLNPLV